jgi:hypothetical protein
LLVGLALGPSLRRDISGIPALRHPDFVFGKFPFGTVPEIDMTPDIGAKSD